MPTSDIELIAVYRDGVFSLTNPPAWWDEATADLPPPDSDRLKREASSLGLWIATQKLGPDQGWVVLIAEPGKAEPWPCWVERGCDFIALMQASRRMAGDAEGRRPGLGG